MRKRRKALKEQFEDKYLINKETGCWDWVGAKFVKGYGQVRIIREDGSSKLKYAHQLAWELENGEVPEGFMLDHVCRNKACVNVSHLEVVTNATNVRRGSLAKLTWDDVTLIKSLYDKGNITFTELGKQFGVHRTTISGVVRETSWKR